MNSILLRAEDKNEWEKRTVLIPKDLKKLVEGTGVKAFIQEPSLRCFDEREYIECGVKTSKDLNSADIILGVKEIPTEKIVDNKVYMFFSHTIKGQSYNMPMLKRIINGGSTLIDYERIVDENNKRLVYFGNFAGDAGATDILWLVGEYLQNRGIQSPLIKCKQANQYESVQDIKEKLRSIGEEIKENGLPESISPLVIGVLGIGKCIKRCSKYFKLFTNRICIT
jgi:hypothetical protein